MVGRISPWPRSAERKIKADRKKRKRKESFIHWLCSLCLFFIAIFGMVIHLRYAIPRDLTYALACGWDLGFFLREKEW